MSEFNRDEFERIKKVFEKRKAKRDSLKELLENEKDRLTELQASVVAGERGLVILQQIAKRTQQNLEYHISNIVTTALSAISSKWPDFRAEIEVLRKTTQCRFLFVEFGEESKPIDSSGGGPLDVASFSLRVSYWSLNKNRPSFILDEPFKYVSPDLQHKVSDMLKMLSEKLKVQIIMVSHAEEVNYSADKTFHVDKEGKLSKVRVEQ